MAIEVPLQNLSIKERNATMTRGEYKTRSLRFKDDINQPRLKKPKWIRAKAPNAAQSFRIQQIKDILRRQNLHSVCEEASCPNLGECFSHGTATFMIMGDICTRKCPFCDVKHGRPNPLDTSEPQHLAASIKLLALKYVVITSVDRDDLIDGGAGHFESCIRAIRTACDTTIETLVPDFRGRLDKALDILGQNPPDVLNHNLETAPALYSKARPGASYQGSLDLLARFKQQHPDIPTKSGLMMGLGETKEQIVEVMADLRQQGVNMLTLGQYLQPSVHHLQVQKYWSPEEFKQLEVVGLSMGFDHVAAGPMVRSSYHADLQAQEIIDIN